MKAKDLEFSELFSVAAGSISIQGRRLVVHSIHAFGQFRKDLLETLGVEHTRRLFTRFGYFWGQADAETMTRTLRWTGKTELLHSGARLQTLEGIAEVSIIKLDLDESAGRYHLECLWKQSGEAEEHLTEVGSSECPICWKLVGYASGFATYCLGKPVYFIERTCRAQGHDLCTAVGKDLDSWGNEITEHLPYFEAEDIVGRVKHLTQQLRKKTQQLVQSRQRLVALRHGSAPFFNEGRSDALRRVVDLADRVAPFDSSILISGETGVGKEVLARYVHGISHRAKGDFVAINCGAIPETLLESELFGHKVGAFTGAIRDRVGLLEEAARGTVFLDEIGDISLAIQMKLLRVLQERRITRIGENRTRAIDVRIVAATNRDLDEAVAKGAFREDLLYRLRVVEIRIPPLRERREDILPMTRFLVERLSRRLKLPNLRLDTTCLDYLQAYPWPGNVRELENAIERAAVLSPDGVIMPDYLPPHIIGEAEQRIHRTDHHMKSLEHAEMDYILSVLRSTGGNRAQAAKILGISATTLWRKLKRGSNRLRS